MSRGGRREGAEVNVQAGLEDVLIGRPAFDDPHRYASVHESIRSRPEKRHMVALCYECMENPKRDRREDEKCNPVRCESCESKHARRVRGALAAKGGPDAQ